MSTLTNVDELLANVGPYLKSAQPLKAMKKAGFTFSGDLEKYLASIRPAIDPASAERLDKELASYVPIRLQTGQTAKPQVPPVSHVVVGGFRATGSINLDNVNPVIEELWQVGTIPNTIAASVTNSLITLSVLSQYCTNVPTAPGATLGGLEILTAPFVSASAVSTGNLNVVSEIRLPVLGVSQPTAFQAKLNVEIPIAILALFTDLRGRFRFSIDPAEAQATLVVSPLGQIKPRSPAALNALNNIFTTGVQLALANYCGALGNGTLTLPAGTTLSSFPNTHFKLTQASGATIQNGQKSFVTLGLNVTIDQVVDPTQLTTVATPLAPFAIQAEIDQTFATDALTAIINSGDLVAYINRIASRHWWGDLLPQMNVDWGTVTFENGNINLAIGITIPHYCLGLDLPVIAVINGPPVISGGAITISAQSVDLSVGASFWCALTGIGALLGMILDIIFLARSSDPFTKTIPSSYSFVPLPGSDEDWTLAVQQASANNGTLTLYGTTTLATDPGYFIYLRIVTGNAVTGFQPVPNAQVTLMELDSPAPAGDDVTVPHTGTTIHSTGKDIITDSTTYTPNSDQTLGTKTTDDNGDVLFIVETSTPSNPVGMNQVGGTLRTIETEIDLHTGKVVSSSNTVSTVPERQPDFGVAVTDSSGNVLATRRLVVLNASSTRIGAAQNPVIVVVNEVVLL